MKTKNFLIIQFLIYISFIVLDILKIDSTYIKYAGIILCLIYAIYNKKKNRTIAMCFTLIADFFLLILNDHYEIGLISFIIVQLTYFYFLGNINKGYFNMFLLKKFHFYNIKISLTIFLKSDTIYKNKIH